MLKIRLLKDNDNVCKIRRLNVELSECKQNIKGK